ncbi:MAG: hypothetical protein QQN63_05570 [Nitrosopumilus sp.]
MFLYVTAKAQFQTEREPSIQEISFMKAGNMKIFQFDENFQGSEFELVTDRGGVHETIERVDQ